MLLSFKLKLPDLAPLHVHAWFEIYGFVPLGIHPLKAAGADQTSMVGVFSTYVSFYLICLHLIVFLCFLV